MNEDANSAHMLSFANYPEKHIKKTGSQALPENVKEGFIGKLGINVVEEKEISINNYVGIYFKASGNGLFCVIKNYIVNNRLYQIGILRSDRYPSDYEIRSYIDSFKLTTGNNDIKRPKPIKEK